MAKKKKKVEYDDKEQSQRFIDKAKELDSDESGKAFDRTFNAIKNYSDKKSSKDS